MLNTTETDVEMDTSNRFFLMVDEFATNTSYAFSTVPEDIVLFKATNKPSNTKAHALNSSWIVNSTEDLSSLVYTDHALTFRFQEVNQTVLSGYPRELLYFAGICFITFAVIGVLGNLISIVALTKSTKLRNATTAFIVNLCFADLLFCSFTMPLSAIQFIEEKCYFGEVLCKLFPLIRYSNGAVSLFSVASITVNRYILIVHPRLYPAVYKKWNTANMIISIWLLSFLFLMFPLMEVWGTLGYDPDVGTCTILEFRGRSPKNFLYITGFGLPSVIFIVCYTRIFFAVRKASKRASGAENKMAYVSISFTVKKGRLKRNLKHSEMPETYAPSRAKRELQVLRVMLVIFILFLVCYLPAFFVKIFRKENNLKYLNVLGYIGVYFSNIINPVIYILMSKEYRRAYSELFCPSKIKQQSVTNSNTEKYYYLHIV